MEIPDSELGVLYSLEWFIDTITRQLKGRTQPLSLDEMQSILNYGEKLLARYSALLTTSGVPDDEISRLIKILDKVLPLSFP